MLRSACLFDHEWGIYSGVLLFSQIQTLCSLCAIIRYSLCVSGRRCSDLPGLNTSLLNLTMPRPYRSPCMFISYFIFSLALYSLFWYLLGCTFFIMIWFAWSKCTSHNSMFEISLEWHYNIMFFFLALFLILSFTRVVFCRFFTPTPRIFCGRSLAYFIRDLFKINFNLNQVYKHWRKPFQSAFCHFFYSSL